MKRKILCIHQSAELYGSDRSFFSAVLAISKKNPTDVILPFTGELSTLLAESGIFNIEYFKPGVLRKKDLKKPFKFFLDTLKGVIFYYKKYKSFDVIYINTIVMLSAILAATGYRFTSKVLICHIREIPSKKQMFFFKILLKMSGVKLVFNSKATKEAFQLPGTIIYNGVDDIAGKAMPQSDERKRDLQIKLLLIGRINTWKGHQLLIDAMIANHLKGGGKRISLDIVGSPFEGYEYLESELKRKVEEYDLCDDIKFIPFTKNPEEFFINADFIVVPSTKPEPFGRVAVEAFSAGKPVIAANHGGLSEIITNLKDGYLFSPNNKDELVGILSDLSKVSSEEYMRMAQNARLKYLSKFSLEAYQGKVNSLVENNL